MRRSRLLAMLGVALAVAGCEFDLTAIDVRARAVFSVSLQVVEVGGPADVRVFFYPGSVSPGRARPLLDDSLRVNGVALAPARTAPNGTRVYEIYGLVPSADALRLQPPAVVDLPEAPPEITVHRVAFLAPDTLVAARDGQMEIAVSGLERIPAQGRTGSWDLRVYSDACSSGAAVVRFSGLTAPPPVLSIPMSLLPDDLRTGHVLAAGHARHDTASSGGYYAIRVSNSYSACIPFRVIG